MSSKEILIQHGLKCTHIRERILDLFHTERGGTLRYEEIALLYGSGLDRVTLYRTMNSFVQAHIVSKFVDIDNKVCYALKQDNEELSVYFKCVKCKSVLSLPLGIKNYTKSLDVFQLNRLSLQAEGICKQCQDD